MNTILVPTDYSETAENALSYAAELARTMDARLLIMHAYQVPVPTGEIPIMMVSPQQLREENEERIQKIQSRILTDKKIKAEVIVRDGFVVEEIRELIAERAVDLVVMGITGAGALNKKLIGGHTSALIRQTHTPVLVVPAEARYRSVEKIVLACDYKDTVNVAVLDRFKNVAKQLNAKVLVLDVEKPEAIPVYENAAASEALETSLKDIEHVMFFSAAEDLTEEISSFADFHQCDWIAMIPHDHNIIRRLFQESNTKRMAFHTHIPLLSIHD